MNMQEADSTSGVETLIIESNELNPDGIDRLLDAHPGSTFVIVDNNPFNVWAGQKDAQEKIDEYFEGRTSGGIRRKDALQIVDHHGFYNDDVEKSAFPRFIERFPHLLSDGFLVPRKGKPKKYVVTDKGNFDPDGLLSVGAVKHPTLYMRHRKLLTEIARITDFEMFGAPRVDENYTWSNLSVDPQSVFHYQVAFAIISLIDHYKLEMTNTALMKRGVIKTPFSHKRNVVTQKPHAGFNEAVETEGLRQKIRGLFKKDQPTDDQPIYDAQMVQSMYDAITDHDIPELVQHIGKNRTMPERFVQLGQLAVERLHDIAAYARPRIRYETERVGSGAPRFAKMTGSTGHTDRMDHNWTIWNWLLESVGAYQQDPDVPVMFISKGTSKQGFGGFGVFSIRHTEPGEKRSHDYNMMPLIHALNSEYRLLTRNPNGKIAYGRKEVAVIMADPTVVSEDFIINAAHSVWHKGHGDNNLGIMRSHRR